MIKIENFEGLGWNHAIRGMRNPMNSWDKSDSSFKETSYTEALVNGRIMPQSVQFDALHIGENDHELMMRLANAGPLHGKFRRMITVYVDITAPLYWWKEFDTYKVGTVANSCSTMHKIHEKEFTWEDISGEHLSCDETMKCTYRNDDGGVDEWYPETIMELIVKQLNVCREKFLETKDKKYWWQMIQLLPSSYNQKRTVQLNYEVLANIYTYRKAHKLDEWVEFCKWIEQLPYSEIITGTLDNHGHIYLNKKENPND